MSQEHTNPTLPQIQGQPWRRKTPPPVALHGVLDDDDFDDEQSAATMVDAQPSSDEANTSAGAHTGRVVGNLTLGAMVGQGSMGTVYRAAHHSLGTPYAVKVLNRRFSQNPRAIERFRREALVCSQLQHPNVIFVTDFGHHPQLGLYIIMEFLDGATLRDLMGKGAPLGLEQVCQLTLQLCGALLAAHHAGITHRDLKPDNVVILERPGREPLIKVLDFGIASIKAHHASALTADGSVMGTPLYMAPEQIMGISEQHGPHTDVYALGTILYEMVAGQRPFMAPSAVELCKMHLRDLPTPPSVHRPELAGSPLEATILAMMAKEPADRPDLNEVAQVVRDTLLALGGSLEPSEEGAAPMTTAALGALGAGSERVELLRSCLRAAPDSSLQALLRTTPQLAQAPDEIFFLLVWASLDRDLRDLALDDPRFAQAAFVLGRVVGMVLDSPQLDDAQRARLLRSVADLLHADLRPRQSALVAALGPLATRPDFPVAILPPWAAANVTGTWHPVQRTSSLLDKLRAPATLENLRHLFKHDPSNDQE